MPPDPLLGEPAGVDATFSTAGVRFRFWGSEAELAGSGEDLHRLRSRLSVEARTPVTAEVSGDGNGTVILEQVGRPGPLRITFDERSRRLLIEGDDRTLPIFWAALEPDEVAGVESDSAVPRHVHLEYLGEGDDEWRAPDTLPLVVVARPSPAQATADTA